MRNREEIEKDGRLKNDLILEVLLDIRELLFPKEEATEKPAVEIKPKLKRKRKSVKKEGK